MTNKGAVMNKDLEIFGMSREDIRADYMDGLTARCCGLEMVVMGILSDCQELTALGSSDAVRKQLNVAKFILSEMMEAKERV
jgi:hypothetical protein